jgi:hypothetical protein
VQNQSERQALKARRGILEKQIASLRSSLANTEGSTVAFTTLRQKVTDLESNYQLYTQKSNEARMEDAMNENRLLNVAVTQSPTFAVTPFNPKPVLDLALATFTAVFLASFAVFFAEMSRSTFATSREVRRLSHYPLLATVPLARAGRGRHPERLSEAPSPTIIMASREASAAEPYSDLGQIAYQRGSQAS